jgi:hypothetical protein
MLRQAGLDAPGALRHIMVRGIDRKKILFNDSGCNDFVGSIRRYPV